MFEENEFGVSCKELDFIVTRALTAEKKMKKMLDDFEMIQKEQKELLGMEKSESEVLLSIRQKAFYLEELGKKIWKHKKSLEFKATSMFADNFNQLFHQSVQEKYNWNYCTLEVYKKFFNEEFKKFKNKVVEAKQMDFCLHELKKIDTLYEPLDRLFDSRNPEHEIIRQNVMLTLDKRREFLRKKLSNNTVKSNNKNNSKSDQSLQREHALETDDIDFKDDLSYENISRVEWRGSNIEIVEVIKSLHLLRKFDPSLKEKEIFKRFSAFLKFDIKDKHGKDKIRQRKVEKTIFLSRLVNSINDWDADKDDNLKNR